MTDSFCLELIREKRKELFLPIFYFFYIEGLLHQFVTC